MGITRSSLWFRYTILDGKEKTASSWAILFHGDKIWTGKNNYPLEDLPPAPSIILPPARDMMRYHQHPQVFHVGENHLDNHNALGTAGDLYWDMRWTTGTHGNQRFTHGPEWIHSLKIPQSRYDACMMDLKFSGSITFPSQGRPQSISFHQAPGMIGHIYGSRQADSWAWAHCNVFDTPHVVFEGLSVKLSFAGTKTPALASFYFFDGEQKYEFRSTKVFLSSHSRWSEQEWYFEAEQNGASLSGHATLSRQKALVEYTDTDGSKLWCTNSKLSSLKLRLVDRKRNIDRDYKAVNSAAFEMVSREKPHRTCDL